MFCLTCSPLSLYKDVQENLLYYLVVVNLDLGTLSELAFSVEDNINQNVCEIDHRRVIALFCNNFSDAKYMIRYDLDFDFETLFVFQGYLTGLSSCHLSV